MSAERELIELERKVMAAVAGDWLDAVARIRTLLATEPEAVRAALLALVAPRVEGALLEALRDAFGLGRLDALGSIPKREGRTELERRTEKAKPSAGARSPLQGLDDMLAEALGKTRSLLDLDVDLDTAVAPILAATNSLNRRASDAINRAGNEGTTRVATAAKLPTVWVAETNACVTCLAYAGRVCQPGESFPGGLTYGPKSYYPEPLVMPPRHGHCRCTVEVLRAQSYADALRREADRSVLRGFSLESESMAARIEAARRLLEAGVVAPKSVIAYAQRAVEAGEFPTRGR